jgi:hypothetical protein
LNLESDYTRKKLTKFLCQELLFEYVTHNLDQAREKEVTDYLATCRDSQRELDNLNKGLRFAQLGGKVTVSPALLHALENFEPRWQKSVRAWTMWSSQRGWKTLPYVALASVLILGILVARPWARQPNNDVTLAEQLKQEPDMLPPAPAPVAPAATAPSAPAAAVIAVPTAAPNVAAAPNIAPKAPAPPKPAPLAVPDPQPEKAAEEADVDMGRGYLFRTIVQVQDFQNSWPAIRDKVGALGGKVAGNVELGWLRKSGEAYFHFTLPESNLKEFEIFLGTFGPVQFSKDRHPRVMPEGQIRIIMSVKDGMTDDEASPETP